MTKQTVDIFTMGCSKNLVDSEQLLALFEKNNFNCYHNPSETHGDIVIINTCGFIGDAKEESIEAILDLCKEKEEGKIKKVLVMGCLSQRYPDELKNEIPEINHIYGKYNWKEIIKDLKLDSQVFCGNDRILTTPPHYAYIKIAEGCDRKCAYCAIPIITGKHKSRPMEEILEEVKMLVDKGVKEFQIIEQELTYYGLDLYQEQKLPELIERIANIKGVEWIRLHYAYPTNFPNDLLRVIRENSNVCNYLDIALQHISTNVLQRMRRHITKEETLEIIHKIRKEVPGICLRTTLMVGFPGETESDFEELKDFIKEIKFDRMGAFAYCEEDDTYAAKNYTDDVDEETKSKRLNELMEIQQEISTNLCAQKIGKTFKTIIDRKEGDYYIGRTEFDSPDVDGEVLIPVNEKKLHIGNFYSVKINAADEFDLYGSVIIK